MVWLPVLLIGAALLVTAARSWTGAAQGVGHTVKQPIPFSHVQHVAEVGLDCAHCHIGALDQANARLPANAICLECHDQLFRGTPELQPLYDAAGAGHQVDWNRIYALPDHARFHHGIHARAGVTCATCHGDIDAMEEIKRSVPLDMDFCVECHRAAQSPAGKQGVHLVSAWRRDLTDCSVCHY